MNSNYHDLINSFDLKYSLSDPIKILNITSANNIITNKANKESNGANTA